MRTALLAVVLLGLVVVVWRLRTTRSRSASPLAPRGAGPAAATAAPSPPPDLRGLVLRREFLAGVAPAPDGRPRAVVMDWSLDRGAATLVAYDDGTTSLYYSSGGGVIGAGAHEPVRRAAEAFRAEAARVRAEFAAVPAGDAMALPPANSAAFYLVTDSATLRAGPVETSHLAAGSHALAAMGSRAQAVITAIRESSPR